jgi:hypothetical protein
MSAREIILGRARQIICAAKSRKLLAESIGCSEKTLSRIVNKSDYPAHSDILFSILEYGDKQAAANQTEGV